MTIETTQEAFSQFIHPKSTTLTAVEVNLITVISRYVVNNDRLESGAKFIDRVVQENQALSERRHGLVIGHSGCGKTTLYDLLKRRMPREEKHFRLGIRANLPMLGFQLPSPVTPKSMAKEMLRAFGDTSNLNGNCFELTERVCGYINECQVQLVVLDELQHLFGLGRSRGRAQHPTARLLEARNWIKSLVNKSNATFILMGVPEIYSLIEDDEQLFRRFIHNHLIAPFACPSEKNTDLIDFVDDMLIWVVTSLPHFKDAEFLCDRPHEAIRLYFASGGIPSRLKDLVIGAALSAYRRGSSTVAMQDFIHGFQSLIEARARLTTERNRAEARRKLQREMDEMRLNPFSASQDQMHQMAMLLAA